MSTSTSTLTVPLMAGNPAVLTDPAPSVGIVAMVPGGMTVAFRAYTMPKYNVPTYGTLIEQIQSELRRNNIQGPFKKKKPEREKKA